MSIYTKSSMLNRFMMFKMLYNKTFLNYPDKFKFRNMALEKIVKFLMI